MGYFRYLNECFDAYVNEYLEYEAVDPGRARIAWTHLNRVLGRTTKPTDLTHKKVTQYATKRREEGAAFGTIQREISTLVACLNWCLKNERIDFVPHIHRFPGLTTHQRILSEDEIVRLLDAAEEDPHVLTFCRIALMTGQRKAAILNLRWDQVDFERKVIDFRDDTLLHAERRKGRGYVPISGMLLEMLEELNEASGSSYVIEYRGQQVRTIDRAFQRAVKGAKLTGRVTPHTLRHTTATRLVAKGVALQRVAQLLGHSSIATTERVYVKRSPEFLRETVEEIAV